jgi:hypothetical protein
MKVPAVRAECHVSGRFRAFRVLELPVGSLNHSWIMGLFLNFRLFIIEVFESFSAVFLPSAAWSGPVVQRVTPSLRASPGATGHRHTDPEKIFRRRRNFFNDPVPARCPAETSRRRGARLRRGPARAA